MKTKQKLLSVIIITLVYAVLIFHVLVYFLKKMNKHHILKLYIYIYNKIKNKK